MHVAKSHFHMLKNAADLLNFSTFTYVMNEKF